MSSCLFTTTYDDFYQRNQGESGLLRQYSVTTRQRIFADTFADSSGTGSTGRPTIPVVLSARIFLCSTRQEYNPDWI